MAKNPSEYDGSVFKTTESVADDPAVEFDRLNDAGSQLPDRDDASGWSSMILSEVESWLSSEAAENASDATMATAKDLALACRVAIRAADSNAVAENSGLYQKLTPAALIELGYQWCQFRIQAIGIERFAGIGKRQHPRKWKSGKPITAEAIKLIDGGMTNYRKLAKRLDAGEGTARRWIAERTAKK